MSFETKKGIYLFRYTAQVLEKSKSYYSGKTYWKLPQQISFYNDFMGSVDRADQLLQPYSSQQKSLAWFKKLGVHFIDRMLLNSYIVYKNQKPSYKEHLLDYIKRVGYGLLKKYSGPGKKILTDYEIAHPPPVRRCRRRNQHVAQPDLPDDPVEPQQPQADDPAEPQQPQADEPDSDHDSSTEDSGVPQLHQRVLKPPTGKKSNPQARCRQCSFEKKLRKDTRYICKLCSGQPGLC